MPQKNLQTLDRVLRILECFASNKRTWGVMELGEEIDLAPSTTHRFLSTLVNLGYLIQDEKLGKYKVGDKFIWLSSSIIGNLEIRSLARPYLKELSLQTEETIHLCMLQGFETLYIDKIESFKTAISINTRIGQRSPAYVSGVGKVLLAHLSENDLKQFFGRVKLSRITENSITNELDLRRHLEEIRVRGYAIDNQEAQEDVVCLAAPIFNYDNKVAAGISISGPAYRLDTEKMEKCIPLVIQAANDISRILGHI